MNIETPEYDFRMKELEKLLSNFTVSACLEGFQCCKDVLRNSDNPKKEAREIIEKELKELSELSGFEPYICELVLIDLVRRILENSMRTDRTLN